MADMYPTDIWAARGYSVVLDTRRGMATLSAQLRQLRAEASLTQNELAARIGVSQPTVSAVERGQATTTDVLEQWVEACGGHLVASRAQHAALLAAVASLSSADVQRLQRVAEALIRVPEDFKDHVIQMLEMFPGRA